MNDEEKWGTSPLLPCLPLLVGVPRRVFEGTVDPESSAAVFAEWERARLEKLREAWGRVVAANAKIALGLSELPTVEWVADVSFEKHLDRASSAPRNFEVVGVVNHWNGFGQECDEPTMVVLTGE